MTLVSLKGALVEESAVFHGSFFLLRNGVNYCRELALC